MKDIKASATCQYTETSFLEERSLTAKGIICDNKEDETIDPTDLSEVTITLVNCLHYHKLSYIV